jgi:hypothetical protein
LSAGSIVERNSLCNPRRCCQCRRTRRKAAEPAGSPADQSQSGADRQPQARLSQPRRVAKAPRRQPNHPRLRNTAAVGSFAAPIRAEARIPPFCKGFR